MKVVLLGSNRCKNPEQPSSAAEPIAPTVAKASDVDCANPLSNPNLSHCHFLNVQHKS